MSGRCKSCNAILTEDEMCAKWSGSDDYVELCSYCLNKIESDDDWEDSILDIGEEEDE